MQSFLHGSYLESEVINTMERDFFGSHQDTLNFEASQLPCLDYNLSKPTYWEQIERKRQY